MSIVIFVDEVCAHNFANRTKSFIHNTMQLPLLSLILWTAAKSLTGVHGKSLDAPTHGNVNTEGLFDDAAANSLTGVHVGSLDAPIHGDVTTESLFDDAFIEGSVTVRSLRFN